MRAGARRLGLGRWRKRVRRSLYASPMWTAVPPHRLKDLDPRATLPPREIALTFDDGPNPEVTPRLLEVLDSYSAPATFFMCGLAAERHPDLVRMVVEAGHSIGGHSWDHPYSGAIGLSESDWHRQIDETHALLADLSGARIRWFRPPRGRVDRRAWERLRDEGIATMLWSVDGWDCQLRDPEVIAAGVLDKLRPGGVALLHDANATFLHSEARPEPGEVGNQESTLRATEIILEEVRRRGLDPIPLDVLPEGTMPRTGRLRFSGAKTGRG